MILLSLILTMVQVPDDPGRPTRLGRRGSEARIESGRQPTPAEAHRVLSEYAACVVRRNRPRVDLALATSPSSEAWTRASRRLATPDCLLEGELRFNPTLMRGALFEAVYRADYRLTAGLPENVDAPSVPITPEGASEQERGGLALQYFGHCVAHANPAAARGLVMSAPASREEGAGFAALQPALGPCLPAGTQLAFSRPILRGVIAEGLVKLSVAAALPTTVTR